MHKTDSVYPIQEGGTGSSSFSTKDRVRGVPETTTGTRPDQRHKGGSEGHPLTGRPLTSKGDKSRPLSPDEGVGPRTPEVEVFLPNRPKMKTVTPPSSGCNTLPLPGGSDGPLIREGRKDEGRRTVDIDVTDDPHETDDEERHYHH